MFPTSSDSPIGHDPSSPAPKERRRVSDTVSWERNTSFLRFSRFPTGSSHEFSAKPSSQDPEPNSRSWRRSSGGADQRRANFLSPRRAKAAVQNAVGEAVKFGPNYVGTEHLLLGLCVDQNCIAAKVLTRLGVNYDDIRVRIAGGPQVKRE